MDRLDSTTLQHGNLPTRWVNVGGINARRNNRKIDELYLKQELDHSGGDNTLLPIHIYPLEITVKHLL